MERLHNEIFIRDNMIKHQAEIIEKQNKTIKYLSILLATVSLVTIVYMVTL